MSYSEERVGESVVDAYGGDELLIDIGLSRTPVDQDRPFSNMGQSEVLRAIEWLGVTQADLAEARGVSESALSQWIRQPEKWKPKKCAEFVDALARARMAKGLHEVRVEGVAWSDCGKLSIHRRILLNVMPLNPSLENSRQRYATLNDGWQDVLIIGTNMQKSLTWADRQQVARHLLALLATNTVYGDTINQQARECMRLADGERFGGDPREFVDAVESLAFLVPEVYQQMRESFKAES